MTDLPFGEPLTAPTLNGAAPRKCRRHLWGLFEDGSMCIRCRKPRDEKRSRRGRTARKRGTSDELRVAQIMGGHKVGPMGWPWDVEIPGYARLQSKQLDRWPSVNEILTWLNAIPQGPELRGVTLADTPGPGKRTQRLVIFDLKEFAGWHGREKEGTQE
jgi:hypothetical protein